MRKALLFLLLTPALLLAQKGPRGPRNSGGIRTPNGSAWLISPSFAVQTAGGDMEYRFGQSYSAGIGVGYKTNKNWTIGTSFQFMFGTNVKNGAQLLNTVLTSRGYLLNQTGNYATFSLDQRGAYGTFDINKTLPGFFAANDNSGFSIGVGAGYIAHWIKINNVGNDSPQVLDPYLEGYDEFSGGLLLKQSIGYQYLASNRRINFRISFEVLEGFTRNYREFSYSTGKVVSGKNLDLIYGLRLEWFLPIYTSTKDDNTYYYD